MSVFTFYPQPQKPLIKYYCTGARSKNEKLFTIISINLQQKYNDIIR